MIDYAEIKETLRKGIWGDLNVFFVELENGDPRPDNQGGVTEFVSHKFTSPYIDGGEIRQSEGEVMHYVSSPTFVVSFTCYSRVKSNALNLALRLREWFKFIGYEYLKDNGLVIRTITPATDRTSFLETGYDNRAGFDVTFSISHKLEKEIDVIETVDLNGEIIGE